MLIQVDVDSTLYPADQLFERVANEEFGVKWPKKYDYWFSGPDIGTTTETLLKVFKRCHSRDYVMTNKPYPYAVETLRGIVEDYPEVEIAYVSDRNEQQGNALRDWLDQEGFLNSPDQHVAATKDKRHWMREIRPEIVIDDRVRTILMARFELGSQVVSLTHPHNVNLTGEIEGVYMMKKWPEIDRTLRDIVIPTVRKNALNAETTLQLRT